MEKKFVEGFYTKLPSEKAPDFIKLKIDIKLEDFIKFVKENENNGWINIDICKSSKGNIYPQLNEYIKKSSQSEKQSAETNDEGNINIEDVPF